MSYDNQIIKERLLTFQVIVKQQISDQMKHRLQQLDEFEENVSEHKGLSRDDYVTRITQISEELYQAWHTDQRVKALKIVIQVYQSFNQVLMYSIIPFFDQSCSNFYDH